MSVPISESQLSCFALLIVNVETTYAAVVWWALMLDMVPGILKSSSSTHNLLYGYDDDYLQKSSIYV